MAFTGWMPTRGNEQSSVCMLYFSYGSNMSTRRLQARVPSAAKFSVAKLTHHRLRFHKIGSKDYSAKCDIHETGQQEDVVFGVVFDIASEEKRLLDKVEGLGYGYEEKRVKLEARNGRIINAFSYYATRIDPALKPFDWYRKHVLIGALEHNLPEHYISMIKDVTAIVDENSVRRKTELSIYGE